MPRFNVPEIRVNKKYADLLLDAKGSSERAQKEAAAFVKQKLDSAKWFVEALKQRQNTLSKTMRAILDYQHDYFLDGDESNLRPMVLKDILKHAQEVLDEDHYGLDTVKDRIIEYLAVLKLKGNMKSPILCLYGPPGVGKTSLGKSMEARCALPCRSP